MVNALKLLQSWALAAEADWSTVPGHPQYGVYGTGYNGWGVQTQQKYLAAMATLATSKGDLPGLNHEWALDRAMAALRFNLASHLTGTERCLDGDQWGHTWISALGIERMMFAMRLLEPHFTEADHDALRTMLCSEAEWLLTDYHRGQHKGITATKWNHEWGNDPESNIWNGALLWRAAARYPDHPHASDWQERAHCFLVNGASVDADADEERLVAGKPLRERHIGPSFFPHWALDHHGYFNVGYMVICVSNVAMLHFDLKQSGLPRPDSLDLHQRDLWQVLRRFIFADGRLARVGGDTRVRYAYCQEYLLPALAYAADHLGDAHALGLIERQLELIQAEADFNGDGHFYSKRLAQLRRQSPLYFTRLETDRACALGQIITYHDAISAPAKPMEDFEESVAGGWIEPEYGAVAHRCPTRLASFSWRAYRLAQGFCLPPSDGHLAEWEHNMGGLVEFCHHPKPGATETTKMHRRILRHAVESFPGGFVTSGAVSEGDSLKLAESWTGTDSAVHQMAFAALPDGHTVVGLQHCRMGPRRGYVATVKGLHLNLPNDLFNGFQRQVFSASGVHSLSSPPAKETIVELESQWANIEDRLGAVSLYGADSLRIHRSPERRAGAMQSLYVEHLCSPLVIGPRRYEAGEMILDSGWITLASVNAVSTETTCAATRAAVINTGHDDVRAVCILGQNGEEYVFAANFGAENVSIAALDGLTALTDHPALADRPANHPASTTKLAPGEARLLKV
ncbi:hypothetical protein [Cerasicoccus arenae]|uniref:Uncharacterized protein n=1 Tax=Cerasicoccus arenae TaxID=424488 RepID=A0A8J3GF59_9BACT|nr:hypothetical protein [Cerasicoccus arenae]MBK1859663.1 hypothetical protein [Cerasicoccus arenae]GHC03920.1 hypothetical protein GCM10007047_20660 [Cerasicoccus arenae]